MEDGLRIKQGGAGGRVKKIKGKSPIAKRCR
jgi:hypothetical protein